MAEEIENSITLTRVIHAPPEELFAAWTDPALLEQWQADSVSFEPFAGGSFRFESESEEEADGPHVVAGEVLDYEQDRRLVERWRYEGADAGEDLESVLTVIFEETEPGHTRLTLVEESAAHTDPESRIFSIEAWNAALAELAELLE